MTWHLTEDVEEFRRVADGYLARDPARSTALLTMSEMVRRHGPQAYGEAGPARFGWWRDGGGAVEGAFVQTQPRRPLLGPMPENLARSLARELRAVGPGLSGVRAADGAAKAFADEWTGGGDWRVDVRLRLRLRLFRLGELTPQEPAPSGRARQAGADDIAHAAAWMKSFVADIGDPSDADHDYTENAARRIADGLLYLWEETDGRPVSMAAHSPLIAGQSRVASVYTPAGLRGRGYAGAITAAVSRAALDAGAEHVLLFTDLANPTSNALYQRLGYRPVADYLDVEFT
ncbi:GNAT family N-acetyltransferase [Streptomyces lunaelactis]|uniref:GNAT family N-acetyltransferase n=1 Tax=Streptomyces lunaelactis TaxID=1535768 RepID=UPI00158538CA|nr:GNAT family N-acetyltransferase [Streptomyces lunaelactis]NUK06015.1 GNAT family N-acetyltransferase [Streptomyces lunaelactis]NUK20535.1 GNAT family N-acetyltransferase [Streptomyces lunaelactis]